MTRAALLWITIGFALVFLAVGLAYWPIPYAKVELPNSLMGPGLVVLWAAAIATRAMNRANWPATVFVLGAAPAAAVMLRVALDTAKDPTSHNLWPFEIVIAAFVGGLVAALGALIGNTPAWLARLQSGRGTGA